VPARPRLLGLLLAATLLLAACGGGPDAAGPDATDDAADEAAATGGAPDPNDWDAVLAEAQGQTVNWYMFGGDDNLNGYITGSVADAAAELGVTLNQVPIGDTVEAVNRVLGEVQAGRTDDGTVDMIWINGENFLTGVQADLWHCGWSTDLPNAALVDYDDPAVNTDFGLPIDGCESAWNFAQSALVYDSAALGDDDVATVEAFLDWVEANPGRFTYPAPPDFTGSMAVRTFLYAVNGGHDDLGEFDQEQFDEVAPQLWERLNALEPSLWRGGETYPQAGTDVVDLFNNGELDAYLTYGAGDVPSRVADGILPETTRVAAFEDGMISNTNYVTIPANSPNKAGAMVIADLLLDPELQLEKARPEVVGYTTVLELDRTDLGEEFAAVGGGVHGMPADHLDRTAPELSGEWVAALEQGWIEQVLQQ
jgi:putative spermidine/putrescine transport system substrate-binding protein